MLIYIFVLIFYILSTVKIYLVSICSFNQGDYDYFSLYLVFTNIYSYYIYNYNIYSYKLLQLTYNFLQPFKLEIITTISTICKLIITMKYVLQGLNFSNLKEYKFPKKIIWKTML